MDLLYQRINCLNRIVNNKAKNELQYYNPNNSMNGEKLLVLQRKEETPKRQSLPSGNSFSIYKGPYKKYSTIVSEKIQELKELEIKIGPLYEDFKKYEKLKEMLDYLE